MVFHIHLSMMFIFWPITDDEDVREKEDWECCCCGAVHPFFGAMLFMFSDLVKIPTILTVCIYSLSYPELSYQEYDVHLVPIIALSIALLTVPFGPVAFIRLYLCMRTHVCSRIHNKIVVFSMMAYFIRVFLFALFSCGYASFALWAMFQGCYLADCLKRTTHFIFWALVALDYSIGSCFCYKAHGFMKDRYLGYFDGETNSKNFKKNK